MLDEIEEIVYEFSEALKYYHRYTDRQLYSYINEIEKRVDALIVSNRPSKQTDFKIRLLNDIHAEYENTVKALREAIINKDYSRARSILQDVITVIRRMTRMLMFMSSEMYIPSEEGAKELEVFIGEGKVAENIHEFDERLKEVSDTARLIFAHLINTPLREINLRDLPARVGLTGRGASRIVSQAVDELRRRVPDLVEVVPDLRRGGLKVRLKV